MAVLLPLLSINILHTNLKCVFPHNMLPQYVCSIQVLYISLRYQGPLDLDILKSQITQGYVP